MTFINFKVYFGYFLPELKVNKKHFWNKLLQNFIQLVDIKSPQRVLI